MLIFKRNMVRLGNWVYLLCNFVFLRVTKIVNYPNFLYEMMNNAGYDCRPTS
jgi:hypothetical protein